MTPRRALVASIAMALAAAGCGGGGADEGQPPRLVVSAAASLKTALTSCTADFPGAQVRLSFAGSDELAAQIRRGVRPDLFAAANTKLPASLQREGWVGRPVRFATNELVLAVPAEGGSVRILSDLEQPGVRLAVGSPSVPVGDYTRQVLSRLPAARGRRILANVRTSEPDVKGVVGKLTQQAVDAGFVYRSDVVASGGRLRAIVLPDALEPTVVYGAAAVIGASNPASARRLLADMVSGSCAGALRRGGFGSPRSA
jgi:molybdate transport system substrate-binding protein